jgi:phage protein U
MMLGNFQFSLKTLSANSLSRSTEFKWVDIDRVGDLPYVQNLGIAKDNVEIEGIFYPRYAAGHVYFSRLPTADTTISSAFSSDMQQVFDSTTRWQTIADIRNSELCKTANNLITDSGEILGKFVIISISENQSYFDKSGIPQKIEFSLSLKRTPGVKGAFVGINGSNSLTDTATNLARSYLKW